VLARANKVGGTRFGPAGAGGRVRAGGEVAFGFGLGAERDEETELRRAVLGRDSSTP